MPIWLQFVLIFLLGYFAGAFSMFFFGVLLGQKK